MLYFCNDSVVIIILIDYLDAISSSLPVEIAWTVDRRDICEVLDLKCIPHNIDLRCWESWKGSCYSKSQHKLDGNLRIRKLHAWNRNTFWFIELLFGDFIIFIFMIMSKSGFVTKVHCVRNLILVNVSYPLIYYFVAVVFVVLYFKEHISTWCVKQLDIFWFKKS